MSDDLTVGGPGTTSVLTTELVDESLRLSRVVHDLRSCRGELAALDLVIGNGLLRAADAPRSAILAEESVDRGVGYLERAIRDAELLAAGLRVAAREYEFVDHSVDRMAQAAAAQLGYLLGSLAPLILAVLLPGALIAGAGAFAFLESLPPLARNRLMSSLGSWLRSKSGVLSDPGTVALVRSSVMSADDVGMGFLRMPPGVSTILGDEGFGVFGVDTSTAAVDGLGKTVGLFRETPVSVSVASTEHGLLPVASIQDRAARLPEKPDQIRIERYSSPGVPDRFELYIAGTADLSVEGDAEPWDMTSNVTAMAGESAGSYRAVEQAMQLAGITADSPVTITGYSQGGLIAAQLAASGDFRVEGLITLGAPAGQVSVPHDIPYLAIEHTNDLIPALGGTFVSSDPVIVRRQLFDGAPPLSEFVLPAHQLANYVDTAGLVDDSSNLTIAAITARMGNESARTMTSTLYLAKRVYP